MPRTYSDAHSRRFASLERVIFRKLRALHRATELSDLLNPPGNHLEGLRGDRAGQYSIRVSDQWRICFEWKEKHAHQVEIVDYH